MIYLAVPENNKYNVRANYELGQHMETVDLFGAEHFESRLGVELRHFWNPIYTPAPIDG